MPAVFTSLYDEQKSGEALCLYSSYSCWLSGMGIHVLGPLSIQGYYQELLEVGLRGRR